MGRDIESRQSICRVVVKKLPSGHSATVVAYIIPGTDGMILKIFSPNNLAKILAFFARTTVPFLSNIDHKIGF
jgi:hypothetical protein